MCGVSGARHRFLARVTGVQLPGQANKRAAHLFRARAERRSKFGTRGPWTTVATSARREGVGGQPPELLGLEMCGLA